MGPRTTSYSSLVSPPHSRSGSISGAAGMNSSSYPHFLSNANRHRSSKSQSSLLRLTTTNTNLTDSAAGASTIAAGGAGGDEHSIRLSDRIASTKPTITQADKLWTQIDVLDDVKTMSNQVKLRGSFFNEAFNAELASLKKSQNKLLEMMATQHSKIKEVEQQKNMYKLNNVATSKPRETTPTPSASGGNTKSGASVTSAVINEATDSGAASFGAGPHDKLGPLETEENKEKLRDFFNKDDNYEATNILHRKQDLKELDRYIEETRQNLELVGNSMKNFDEAMRELW